jgi:hypothetical protein
MAYELAAFEPRQREDYLRLLRDTRDLPMSDAEFGWWFEQNPAGSLRSVACVNGRVVGVAGHSLYRMVIEGEERLATFSVHAATDASARGQGIFSGLERKHETEAEAQGAVAAFAFASRSTDRIFLGPLGWTEIGRLRIWVRPLPRFLRPRDRRQPAPRFDHAGDAAAGWPNHVVRDAAYLNWRYVESPKGYLVFRSDGGYAVLGHKVHHGQPIAVVADLVSDDPRPLLRACLAAARPGSRALFALPAPEQRRTYVSLGFVPTPLSLHFMGKPFSGGLNSDPGGWRFTLGDTDFF